MIRIQKILQSVNLHHIKSAMFSTKAELPSKVLIFADKQTIVSWHPEQHFPYEHSLPLPEENVDTSSLLVNADNVRSTFYKNKKPIILVEELAKMTFTTKHRWFPRKRDIRAKKTPPNRPYL